jgi:oligopeptide transport system permease protein
MTAIASQTSEPFAVADAPPSSLYRRVRTSHRLFIGGVILSIIALTCVASCVFTLNPESKYYYDRQDQAAVRMAPEMSGVRLFGSDVLGRSILARCLLGGTISLAIGAAAAAISVVLGVSVGLIAGYRGGWVDSVLMRIVDILYGLPYILLVILFKIAFEDPLGHLMAKLGIDRWSSPTQSANVVILFSAIGLVSWLTMARVVRGQVLSLRAQPFIEACKAMGLPERRIFVRHILPNLIGPISVYATLVVPNAILQESFLSFLGVGIAPPLPTWGSLASDGLLPALNPLNSLWWMLLFPCLLLVITLLSLNFIGDGLRDVFDPRKESAKI